MGHDAVQPRQRAQTLGRRESGTQRLEEAVASFLNVLQVNPDDEGAYIKAYFLYHEKLFAFAKAYDLNQTWLGRHPYDVEAQENFASRPHLRADLPA